MTESFWTLKLTDCINFAILAATIVAIVYGPIRAVEITRHKDIERDAETRKRLILSTLMRTRKMVMHPDHVSALNQVQLEFFNYQMVVDAYRAYIANLSETVPPPGNDLRNFLTRRNDLFFDLLYAIAIASGVALDRHELDRLAYIPLGWQTEQDELRVFRSSVLAVLQGQKPLFVAAATPQQTQVQTPPNPFPPAPA
ncbi:hypothetical protein AS156_30325 [Bradyrhizobium macuxiense]|uniref:DUF6680 domain-containing protein n=1 Tax=Bradyrhizobium macuxiense TaxID=1755647 RepID=A0A109K335_9BRAD|nr:DUF6680 family protein [Bradyrhizobium macuxiense]KWV59823.1 hypothetical protein AS156_30325 [Bradyrhizobium macuxiense]